MTNVARWIAHGLFACAVLVLTLLRGSDYDWMTGMDGAIDATQIEGGGNRAVTAGLALMAALVAQGLIAASARSSAERGLAFALAVGAVVLFMTG